MFSRERLRPLATASLVALIVAGSLVGQAAARPKPEDNGTRCALWDEANGEWDFFLPGETVALHDGYNVTYWTCQGDGTWKQISSGVVTAPPSGTLPPTISQPPPAIR